MPAPPDPPADPAAESAAANASGPAAAVVSAALPVPPAPEPGAAEPLPPGRAAWRDRWYRIIFEHDTRAGQRFDILLLIAILTSVLVVVIDSVESIHAEYNRLLLTIEIAFTLLFTVEYVVRLIVAPNAWRYARSFYGVVDLLSILPTYIVPLLPVSNSAARISTVRALRLLRAFRIFKLRSMLTEADALQAALVQSRAKIAVFISAVLIAVVIAGSALHLVEGVSGNPGFDSIPKSMYFTVVTMSTVGYGDIAPATTVGKLLTTAIILLGYSLIVVPTGIVSAEISRSPGVRRRVCDRCGRTGHDADARFCKQCGERLPAVVPTPPKANPTQATSTNQR